MPLLRLCRTRTPFLTQSPPGGHFAVGRLLVRKLIRQGAEIDPLPAFTEEIGEGAHLCSEQASTGIDYLHRNLRHLVFTQYSCKPTRANVRTRLPAGHSCEAVAGQCSS